MRRTTGAKGNIQYFQAEHSKFEKLPFYLPFPGYLWLSLAFSGYPCLFLANKSQHPWVCLIFSDDLQQAGLGKLSDQSRTILGPSWIFSDHSRTIQGPSPGPLDEFLKKTYAYFTDQDQDMLSSLLGGGMWQFRIEE